MRSVLLFSLAVACLAADSDFNGRWDISVPKEPRARAWWLEVTGAGTPALAGKFVGAPGGQLDVIPQIRVAGGQLEFVFERKYSTPGNPRTGPERKGIYTAKLVNGKLEGAFEVAGEAASKLTWTGVRTADIREHDDGSWKPGKAVAVFNGRDLNGWHSRLPNRDVGWKVSDGMLNNGNAGVPDLISDRTFWNFTLHVEYRIGKGSNSGVGLRGRYEAQIFDDYGEPPSPHGNGAIYSRIPPSVNASRKPGEWQTLDIRLVGRDVTVVLNDQKIIDKQVIEGLTAIATDPNEGQPGPIVLQGDHGPVEFRQVTLTPLER